jgi:hypothetical protein
MLYPMGGSSDARDLISAANPVPDPETGHRRMMHFLEDNGQIIV